MNTVPDTPTPHSEAHGPGRDEHDPTSAEDEPRVAVGQETKGWPPERGPATVASDVRRYGEPCAEWPGRPPVHDTPRVAHPPAIYAPASLAIQPQR
jgi:hypothetical protein